MNSEDDQEELIRSVCKLTKRSREDVMSMLSRGDGTIRLAPNDPTFDPPFRLAEGHEE